MAETSFPIKEMPLTDQQWGQVTRGVGSGILSDDILQYNIAFDNATDTAKILNGPPQAQAQAIVSGFYHRIDAPVVLSLPAVTSTTCYYIGLTYDPAQHKAASGPVKLTCTTAPPSGSGKVYVGLWEVVRQANQLLTDAKLTDKRRYVAPSIAVLSTESLTTADTLIGTRAYHIGSGRTLWLNPNKVWEPVGDAVTVNTGVGISGTMPAGRAMIQAGNTNVRTNEFGDATITFPRPFPAGLVTATLTPYGVDTGGSRTHAILSLNTDRGRVSFRSYDSAGNVLKNFPCSVSWMAMGW